MGLVVVCGVHCCVIQEGKKAADMAKSKKIATLIRTFNVPVTVSRADLETTGSTRCSTWPCSEGPAEEALTVGAPVAGDEVDGPVEDGGGEDGKVDDGEVDKAAAPWA